MIPGWILVLIAAIGLGLSGAPQAFTLQPRNARRCHVGVIACAVLLALAAMLIAVRT